MTFCKKAFALCYKRKSVEKSCILRPVAVAIKAAYRKYLSMSDTTKGLLRRYLKLAQFCGIKLLRGLWQIARYATTPPETRPSAVIFA